MFWQGCNEWKCFRVHISLSLRLIQGEKQGILFDGFQEVGCDVGIVIHAVIISLFLPIIQVSSCLPLHYYQLGKAWKKWEPQHSSSFQVREGSDFTTALFRLQWLPVAISSLGQFPFSSNAHKNMAADVSGKLFHERIVKCSPGFVISVILIKNRIQLWFFGHHFPSFGINLTYSSN